MVFKKSKHNHSRMFKELSNRTTKIVFRCLQMKNVKIICKCWQILQIEDFRLLGKNVVKTVWKNCTDCLKVLKKKVFRSFVMFAYISERNVKDNLLLLQNKNQVERWKIVWLC